jgi:hypothetical protein
VADVSGRGVVLLLGEQRNAQMFSWECLEGTVAFLHGRGWVKVGANRDPRGNAGTFDGYLKEWVTRQTANYVAVLLERAGIVELDRALPARLRLRS